MFTTTWPRLAHSVAWSVAGTDPGLAATAGAHHRHHLAGVHRQVDPAEGAHLQRTGVVDLDEADASAIGPLGIRHPGRAGRGRTMRPATVEVGE